VASFGMRLKQEREKKAVTLDDISLSTKISTRMLRALEEERFDQLPGGIFNKGFIRAYARCLGMDEEQAIAEYVAATSPSAKTSENSDQAPILDPPPRERNDNAAGLPWGIFAVVLLIVALGFVAWGFYSRQSQKGTPASAAPADPSPNLTPAPAAEPPPSQQTSQTAVPPAAGGDPSHAPAASLSAPTPSQSPPVRAGGFTVLIKAREDSWLSVSIDGEVSMHSTLTAQTQKSVRAQEEITIRAGNTGALDFEFNGKKLPPQGGSGEVKTLTFDANGLRPPTPKPEQPAQLP
jgi:cytoskeleton protein RodZ